MIYENGDTEQINIEVLADFGSQSNIDKLGAKKTGKDLAYIQVYTDLAFLPANVSIIDTPGISSTYPFHTKITKEYMKYADAVVYVMTPAPLKDDELSFIKNVTGANPNMFFLMTKIDDCDPNTVAQNVNRNIDLLSILPKDALYKSPVIFPFSSYLLKQSSQSRDKEIKQSYYDDSLFENVKKEILSLIFKTQGFYRASIAYNEVVQYYSTIERTLAQRAAVANSKGADRESIQERYQIAKDALKNNLGEGRRKEVLDSIEQIIQSIDYEFNLIFNTTDKSPILCKYFNDIDNLDENTIEEYAFSFSEKLYAELQSKWDGLCNTVNKKIAEQLELYDAECQASTGFTSMVPNNFPLTNIEGLIHHSSRADKFKSFRSNGISASFVVGGVGSVLNLAAMASTTAASFIIPVFGPLMAIASVAGLCWAGHRADVETSENNLKQSKANLKTEVKNIINQSRNFLVNKSIADGRYLSQYQGFINVLRESAIEAMANTYQKYKNEVDELKIILDKSAQEESLSMAINTLLKNWTSNKSKIQSIHDQLSNCNVD